MGKNSAIVLILVVMTGCSSVTWHLGSCKGKHDEKPGRPRYEHPLPAEVPKMKDK